MKLRLLVILIVLGSCKDIHLEKIDETTLVEEELKSINWNSVDQYPTFRSCDSVSDLSSELCFKSTFVQHINSALARANIVVTEDLSDTLLLKIHIDQKGAVRLTDVQAKKETYDAISRLDSILNQSISSLPKVYPAIKRGQQVSTEFQLPVVIAIK
jgi:hypothetical protein